MAEADTTTADTGEAAGADGAAELLRRCAGGDRAAFSRLYEGWGARLHGVALRITRDRALAADATHDAFVQVWQRADRFDASRGNPEAWLVSLVRYRALDLVRRRGREAPGYEPPEQEDESPSALARLVTRTEGAALHRCLEQIAADRRRLVTLAFVDGLSHSDLSAHLGVPLGTVKSWIRRSLMSLKECLAS
jgi:RNA polymerase sigma-70 factor (ECF subfamily)